ncbi:MAG: hypothetical protein K6U74_01440 [Firmicutes bacterium]|nr:hypothetical protein [Bacillota bacterium]
MANSTLLALRAAVRRILLDKATSANSRWSDDELKGFFNAAILDMSRVARRLKIDSAISFAAGEDYKAWAPADYLELYKFIWVTNSGGKYDLVSGAQEFPMSTDTGDPKEYWYIDGKIYVRPIPDRAGTLTPVYYRRFADLVNDEDIPEPEDADDILKARALAEALDFDGNPLSKIWSDKYDRLLGFWTIDEKRRQKQSRIYRVRTQPFM